MLLVFGVLSLGLLQAVTPPAAATPPTPEHAPVYGPSHIEDDTLHLSFDLPDGIRSRPDVADKISQTFVKKSPTGENCVSLQTLAFDPVVIRRIYVYRYRGDCLAPGIPPETLRNLVSSVLTGILKSAGKPTMASPLDYELAGHRAAAISGNAFSEINHGILFGEMACASVEGDAVCWAFVSSTAPKTSRLAALPVRIGDKDPIPIIPEDLSHFVAVPSITYRDEQRHLEFTYPGSFANADPRARSIITKKAEEGTEQQKQALSCMKVLLTADDLEDNDRSNILLYAFPYECGKLKPSSSMLRDFAIGIAKGAAKLATGDIGKPTMYKLGKRDAAAVRITLHLPTGKDAQLVEACTILGPDVLCWQFTSSSADRLLPLGASTVSISGEPAIAILPPGVLIKTEQK